MSRDYTDIKGRSINVYDQVLYAAARRKLQIGRVRRLLPDGKGVEVVGKGNRRTAIVKDPDEQMWQLKKEYYKNHKTWRA